MDRQIIHQETFKGVRYTIYENQICFVEYPDYVQLDIEIAMKGDEILSELNLGPHYYIAEFQPFSDISNEAKEYFASERATELGLCHAVILKSKTLQFLANAYQKFNKPLIPTKFFNSMESANDWVLHLKSNVLVAAKEI